MSDPLRILFISETGADAIGAELQRGGYEPYFERAATEEDLVAALGAGCDIAISDFTLGDFGALEALRTISDSGVDLPLIVVSGEIADAEVLAVLKAGAADHLRRGALMRLNAAVERELRAVKARRARARLEEQFRQAQKMEAVGRMAGGIAHDFNNLLTVITGYSDVLLSGGDLNEAQRGALEEIRRASERGGQLTRQLLTFSRRQPLEPGVIRVNELVLQMEKMLRRLIGEDIELETVTGASRDAVEVDAGGLEQVIMNLAVNARDAMPHGGRLTIETATLHLSESFTATQLGVAAGPACGPLDLRYGNGHGRRNAEPRLRAFLHDQGGGTGNRARPRHGLRDRPAERRRDRAGERAGEGNHGPRLSARCGDGGAGCGAGAGRSVRRGDRV